MKLALLLLVCLFSPIFANPAVTYDQCWGRFGDNLINYLHAKWLSYQYEIPLLYKPFVYSSQLIMDDIEIPFDKKGKRYKKQIILNDANPKPLNQNFLYVCPYFPECDWEIENEKRFTFDVDWENQEFRKIAREMIAPKIALNLIYPREDIVSIAMHLREGGGFDIEELKLLIPLNFLPFHFILRA